MRKYGFILLIVILITGCSGASPQWKAAGIDDSEIERYWSTWGVYNPSDAKTYMSCDIKGAELKAVNPLPAYPFGRTIKYGDFENAEKACEWKNWCSKINKLDSAIGPICSEERMLTLDEAGIKTSDDSAKGWYEVLSKLGHRPYSSVSNTEYILAAKEAGLTSSEVKKYSDDTTVNILPIQSFKLMSLWKAAGFSMEDDIFNKKNCTSSIMSCYQDISPVKIKELIEKYGFSFSDAIYVQKSGKDPKQIQLLAKELNISLSVANSYLTYFKFSESKRVYLQTKSISNTDIRLLSEYMAKGQSIAQAQKSIKDYNQKIQEMLYRHNHVNESCKVDKFNTELNSKLKKFDCSKSLLGGYNRCSAEFDIDISSSCKKTFTAEVKCSAEIIYQVEEQIIQSRAYENESKIVYGSNGSGNDDLIIDNINVSSIIGKTYRAKLSEARCEIDYIH